jgi:hypothetical protein
MCGLKGRDSVIIDRFWHRLRGKCQFPPSPRLRRGKADCGIGAGESRKPQMSSLNKLTIGRIIKVMQMKKEYIAVYLGLALFFVIFVCSALLDSAGRKRQCRIGMAISMIVFGITVLIGLYSNIKNYGYFWTNVRQRDRNLTFAELDEKYPRTYKGTTRYRLVMGSVAMVAVFSCIYGVVLLIREM